MENKKQFIKNIFFTLVTIILFFFLMEGLCSTTIVLKDVMRVFARVIMHPNDPIPERYYTKYDELLGWVNIPNHEVKNLYGPGRYLKTNSQGFRNTHDFSVKVPQGKIRIICCGDSFTLGHGVDNDQTWCAQLSSIDGHLETINMGQAGYGIDQEYLWYMRDGRKLDHNIHLFTFTTDDFCRMTYSERDGYGKPVLRLVNSELKIENVPAPKPARLIPKLTRVFYKANQFSFYRLYKEIREQFSFPKRDINPVTSTKNIQDIQEVALKIFETLQAVNKEKGSKLILVYLPSQEGHDQIQTETNMWRKWLSAELPKRGILYIDLYDEILNLPPEDVKLLYLGHPYGHYSEEGNRFIAQEIYRRLLSYKLLD